MTRGLSSPENLGITDPDFAKTNLYWKNQPRDIVEKRKGIVLSGIQDTGLANAASPIFNELANRGWTVFTMAKGSASEILSTQNDFNRSRYFDPIIRIERMWRGEVLITGFSAIPSVEAMMNYTAHRGGKLVVAIEDFPGAYTHDLKDLFAREPMTKPELLMVGNEWAKQVNVENGFPSDQIIVPGFTALDASANIDKLKTKLEVRDQLGIPQGVLTIGWFGQVGGATIEHLRVFLSGLNELKLEDYRLVVRLHPTDENPKSIYNQLFDPIKDKVVYAGRDVERKVERVIAALDLGVNERSTTAIIGASLDIPFVSIAVPEINDRHKTMLGLRVGVIEDGSSPLIEDPKDMAGTLDRVLNDQDYKAVLFSNMRNWQSDGQSAFRAANEIEARLPYKRVYEEPNNWVEEFGDPKITSYDDLTSFKDFQLYLRICRPDFYDHIIISDALHLAVHKYKIKLLDHEHLREQYPYLDIPAPELPDDLKRIYEPSL